MAGAILLAGAGAWLLTQLFAGGAIERLGISGQPTVPGQDH